MCRRLHELIPFALALLLLLGSWAGSPAAAQDVPEPQPEPQAKDAAEAPPSALDDAEEAPELPMPEAPEAPQAPRVPEPPRVSAGERVVIFESVTIAQDETVREVVVIGGSLTILGHVEREAVVVGGPARVEGRVDRELTVVGGSLSFGPGASVGRDVTVVGGTIEGEEQAEIGGAVNNVRLGPFFHDADWGDLDIDLGWRPHFSWLGHGASLVWHLVRHAFLLLLLCFAFLVAPDAVQRVEAKARSETGKSILVAILAALASVPLVVLFILLTCGLGALVVPFLILAAVALWLVGYAAVALLLGRFLDRRLGWSLSSPYLLILLGFSLVEVWGFLHALIDVPALWWLSIIIGLPACAVAISAYLTAFGSGLLTWMDSRRRDTVPYPPNSSSIDGPPLTEPPKTPPAASEIPEEPDDPRR